MSKSDYKTLVESLFQQNDDELAMYQEVLKEGQSKTNPVSVSSVASITSIFFLNFVKIMDC
jgi:hypothetical protein